MLDLIAKQYYKEMFIPKQEKTNIHIILLKQYYHPSD